MFLSDLVPSRSLSIVKPDTKIQLRHNLQRAYAIIYALVAALLLVLLSAYAITANKLANIADDCVRERSTQIDGVYYRCEMIPSPSRELRDVQIQLSRGRAF